MPRAEDQQVFFQIFGTIIHIAEEHLNLSTSASCSPRHHRLRIFPSPPPPRVRISKINSLISATYVPSITLFSNANIQYLPIFPSQPHTLLQTCSPSETKKQAADSPPAAQIPKLSNAVLILAFSTPQMPISCCHWRDVRIQPAKYLRTHAEVPNRTPCCVPRNTAVLTDLPHADWLHLDNS